MTEPGPTGAPRPPDTGPAVPPNPTEPGPTPEILDLDKYVGLYGRLLIASTKPPEELESVLKPDAPIGAIPEIKVDDARNYSEVTWNLSATERVNAWQGKDNFNDNLSEWKRKFTSAINADQKRKKAFAIISGKVADQYSVDDAGDVYKNLCLGKSDITAFARTGVDNLVGADGKVKKEDLDEIRSQIEWIASKLFGKQTSLAVSRIVEIEASIKNEAQAAIDSITSEPDRINILTPEEQAILTPVHDAIVEGPPPGFEIVPVAPIKSDEDEDRQGVATRPATPPTPAEGPPTPPTPATPEPEPAAAAAASAPETGSKLGIEEDTLPSGEKIIPLHETEEENRKNELRSGLADHEGQQYVPFGRPVDDLAEEHLRSVLGDKLIGHGEVEISEDGNSATIRDVEIENAIPFTPPVKLDVLVSNSGEETGELTAEIIGDEPILAKGHPGEDLKGLTGSIGGDYGGFVEDTGWQFRGAQIRGGKLVVGFTPKTSLFTQETPKPEAAAGVGPEPPAEPPPSEPPRFEEPRSDS